MPNPPVSIVTVTRDGYFFVRLLVEKVRAFIGPRDYEIIAVDRGSRDHDHPATENGTSPSVTSPSGADLTDQRRT